MFSAAMPPAIEAPCANHAPVGIVVGIAKKAPSPNCKWAFVTGDTELRKADDPAWPGQDTAGFIDARTGAVVSSFYMDASAMVHWLRDDKYAIVNYFDGSSAAQPLLFNLVKAKHPTDLAELVFPDVLKRIHKRRSHVYHYYVYFIADEERRITISASPDFTLVGDEGQGDSRCYIYSIDKITLKYHFVQRLAYDDTHPCPHNPDEKWDHP
jgi:hypothetical protein